MQPEPKFKPGDRVRYVRKLLCGFMALPVAENTAGRDRVRIALETIAALNLFHPMHGESFPGWPKEPK